MISFVRAAARALLLLLPSAPRLVVGLLVV
jgi:hypothetical protein